ncbi:hypothetical protein HDV00_002054 [Rhizophlyctis rosea]|nr:hypothetical protein HDV00_002054 [Rhizophlyctis rosea]
MTTPHPSTIFPPEVWIPILSYLPHTSIHAISRTSHHFLSLTRDPYVRACIIWHRYGDHPIALYHAFTSHKRVLTPEVATLLAGAGRGAGSGVTGIVGGRGESGGGVRIPRFLLQMVQYHQADCTVRQCPCGGRISTSLPRTCKKCGIRNGHIRAALEPVAQPMSELLYGWFITQGITLYGPHVNFLGDDYRLFMDCLANEDLPGLHTLIFRYLFVPCSTTMSISERIDMIFRASQLDITLLDGLIANGLYSVIGNPGLLNRHLMRLVVMSPDFSLESLNAYRARGFPLRTDALKIGLSKCDRKTLEVLREVVEEETLRGIAEDLFYRNFAEDTCFSGELWNFLEREFAFDEGFINQTVYDSSAVSSARGFEPTMTTAPSTSTTPPTLHPPLTPPTLRTRAAKSYNPSKAFRFILGKYGLDDPLTHACFSDAISLIPTLPNEAALAQQLAKSGVPYEPGHVRTLAWCATRVSGLRRVVVLDLCEGVAGFVEECVDRFWRDERGRERRGRVLVEWYGVIEETVRVLELVVEAGEVADAPGVGMKVSESMESVESSSPGRTRGGYESPEWGVYPETRERRRKGKDVWASRPGGRRCAASDVLRELSTMLGWLGEALSTAELMGFGKRNLPDSQIGQQLAGGFGDVSWVQRDERGGWEMQNGPADQDG